jgi:hypothetical protein
MNDENDETAGGLARELGDGLDLIDRVVAGITEEQIEERLRAALEMGGYRPLSRAGRRPGPASAGN